MHPKLIAETWDAAAAGDHARAQALHHKMVPLADALFLETNPIPVKEALIMMERIAPELRLPLVRMNPALAGKLRAVLVEQGLL